MFAYRVFAYLPGASPGEPGYPLYEHRPQRGGRIDHPDYYVWYLARQPEAAIGEIFGNLATWDASMFEFPALAGATRALGVYQLPDDLRVLDLDDPQALVDRAMRPTHVVVRNLSVTQAWGRKIWDERDPHNPTERLWQAVQWWSYQRPSWTVLGSWLRPALVDVEALSLAHRAVGEAATALLRPIP